MTVSSYQIQNVLRIYNKQLRNEKVQKNIINSPHKIEDEVNISLEGKRKQVFEQLTTQVKEKVISKDK